MRLRSVSIAVALAALAQGVVAPAQPVAPVVVPAVARLGDAPEAPGVGVQTMAVLSFFHGFPMDLRDARDLIDGRSLAPAFHTWCGVIPYVDFTNAAVPDSMGREAPTALCLPFLDPAREMAPRTCRAVSPLPAGAYYQGGGLALRVEGGLALRRAGEYTLAWGHDDGMGFSFADTPVFEFRETTGSRVDRRVIRVSEPGLYLFTLEWFDTYGGALIDWYIAEGDASQGGFDARFRLVPTDDLYPAGSLGCTARCERCGPGAPRCDLARGRCVACLDDDDCGRCGRCDDGRCVARDVPGCRDAAVEVAGDAAADASEDVRDEDPLDAAPAVDGAAPTAPPEGCACGARAATSPGWGGLAAAWMALGSRRRRRP